MRILVTRAAEDAARTAQALAAAGHEAVLAPVIEIIGTGADWPDGTIDAVLATSAHAFAMLESGPSYEAMRLLPLYLVGARTLEMARERGFEGAATIAANAAELLARFGTWPGTPRRLLYLAGRDRKPDIETALDVAGQHLQVIEVYEARPVPELPAAIATRIGAQQAPCRASLLAAQRVFVWGSGECRGPRHLEAAARVLVGRCRERATATGAAAGRGRGSAERVGASRVSRPGTGRSGRLTRLLAGGVARVARSAYRGQFGKRVSGARGRTGGHFLALLLAETLLFQALRLETDLLGRTLGGEPCLFLGQDGGQTRLFLPTGLFLDLVPLVAGLDDRAALCQFCLDIRAGEPLLHFLYEGQTRSRGVVTPFGKADVFQASQSCTFCWVSARP